ncbi:MAG: nucleotidyltransferase family protein [Myxococcota bacterium]
MILAAGLGTRLRPLTLTTPKPLIKLKGKPLIQYALDYMVQAGVSKIAINTHYLAEQIPEALGNNYQGVPLHYLYEPEILGTGGGLKNACDQVLGFDETVFLMNSDILVDLDVKGFLDAHQKADPDVSLLLKTVDDPEWFGAIGTNEHGYVKTMVNFIPYYGEALLKRMFCGTHLISPQALRRLPNMKSFGIIEDFYVPLVKAGAEILGVEQAGVYSDLGTIESLNAAER